MIIKIHVCDVLRISRIMYMPVYVKCHVISNANRSKLSSRGARFITISYGREPSCAVQVYRGIAMGAYTGAYRSTQKCRAQEARAQRAGAQFGEGVGGVHYVCVNYTFVYGPIETSRKNCWAAAIEFMKNSNYISHWHGNLSDDSFNEAWTEKMQTAIIFFATHKENRFIMDACTK